jgi:Family of unknown function (DUF5990)
MEKLLRSGSGRARRSTAQRNTDSPASILRVRVVCTDLPGTRFRDPHDGARPERVPVHLGVQRGREVVDQVPADRRQVTFAVEFRVERRPDGAPNFLGPFAQGPPEDRFFYLSWGVPEPSGTFAMFRRLKVHLGHLRWPEIRRAIRAGKPLTVTLRLTDDAGAPLCATPPAGHIRWDVD